jgi:hypothetical protein
MRRALIMTGLVLSLAALCLAQQVVVREPNGTEHWKKGEYKEIKWGCVNCTGTAEIHLVRLRGKSVPGTTTTTRTVPATPVGTDYQTLGVIKASISINPGTQFYSHNWRVGDYIGGSAPVGDGYKILVKIVMANGTVSDVGDSGFVIGAPPTIDTLAINDGLTVTNQRRVTLNYTFSGFPSPGSYRVRCLPTPGTIGPWTPLAAGAWPTYDLPQQPGDYTIELWLANDMGSSPSSKTDTIRYEIAAPPPAIQDYTVTAASIVCRGIPEMNPAWYSCRCTSYSVIKPPATDCSCTSTGSVIVKTTAQGPLGTKVEYEFFGGRPLNSGWSFVSLSYSTAGCKAEDGAGSAILVMPQAGSRDILFKVRLWVEGVSVMPYTCEFRINSLVIRGPVGRPVSEAFR